MKARDVKRINRREFLKGSALGAATGAAWLNGWRPAAAQVEVPVKSKVVEMTSTNVQREDLIDGAILRQMVERGMMELIGARNPRAAWRR
ncbi:MAG: twin-arginine translocation signal domain-containing protein, partial [Candidatus Poribacteria bacterium]|nr:twin-arginine translocation signal domain-containing protein [Candidatus Poribacteria bacterium]